MATILCVEASGDTCSVAFGDGVRVIARTELAVRAHNRRLLGMVDEVLEEAGASVQTVEVIGFGRGPGSFTGVRLAAAAAQGYALAGSRALVGVCSMRALARRTFDEMPAARRAEIMLDARMGQVYVAVFERTSDDVAVVLEPRLAAPADLAQLREVLAGGEDTVRAGGGWQVDGVDLPAGTRHLADLAPRAVDVLGLLAADLAAGRCEPSAHAELPWLDGGKRWRRQDGGGPSA